MFGGSLRSYINVKESGWIIWFRPDFENPDPVHPYRDQHSAYDLLVLIQS